MSDDELTTTQEELAEAKAELEELQVGTADREARSAHLESELAEALAELATAQDTAKARDLELAGVSERTQALESQARDAAQRYRDLALRGAPELPEELVAGETVEENALKNRNNNPTWSVRAKIRAVRARPNVRLDVRPHVRPPDPPHRDRPGGSVPHRSIWSPQYPSENPLRRCSRKSSRRWGWTRP